MDEDVFYKETGTRFGTIGILWMENPTKVQRIVLRPEPNLSRSAQRKENPEIQELLASIKGFVQGKVMTLDLNLINLDLCSDFQKKVLLAEYGIPRGSVSTYNRIAKYIGSPKAARAVGNALATNPFPLVIPCHRAVRSDGSLGGYQGGTSMKKELLEMEGVEIENNKVLMENLAY
jgi:methylated-DNA-[protein]-cysteine S-methyltransferase